MIVSTLAVMILAWFADGGEAAVTLRSHEWAMVMIGDGDNDDDGDDKGSLGCNALMVVETPYKP